MKKHFFDTVFLFVLFIKTNKLKILYFILFFTVIVFTLISNPHITYNDGPYSFHELLEQRQSMREQSLWSRRRGGLYEISNGKGVSAMHFGWGMVFLGESFNQYMTIKILPKMDHTLLGGYIPGEYNIGARCLGGLLYELTVRGIYWISLRNIQDFSHVSDYLNSWAHYNNLPPLSFHPQGIYISRELINDLGQQAAYDHFNIVNPETLPDPMLRDQGSKGWVRNPIARYDEYHKAFMRARYPHVESRWQ